MEAPTSTRWCRTRTARRRDLAGPTLDAGGSASTLSSNVSPNRRPMATGAHAGERTHSRRSLPGDARSIDGGAGAVGVAIVGPRNSSLQQGGPSGGAEVLSVTR
jgi:hypothetical protein